MKTISPYLDPIHDTVMWVQASPVHAVIGCMGMYLACWVISYFMAEMI